MFCLISYTIKINLYSFFNIIEFFRRIHQVFRASALIWPTNGLIIERSQKVRERASAYFDSMRTIRDKKMYSIDRFDTKNVTNSGLSFSIPRLNITLHIYKNDDPHDTTDSINDISFETICNSNFPQ